MQIFRSVFLFWLKQFLFAGTKFEIELDLTKMGEELKAFTGQTKGLVDQLTTEQEKTRARLLDIEQKLSGRLRIGAGDEGDKTVAPRDAISGLPILSKSHRFAQNLPEGHEARGLSLGKMLRGLAVNKWDGAAEERKALAESPSTAGGVFLPLEVAAEVIDFARDASVVNAAGARTFPVTAATTRVPRITGDAMGEWKTENEEISAESDILFDSVDIVPHTLMCVVRSSVELVEDGGSLFASAVTSAIQRALGLQLDAAALTGAGGGSEPVGLRHNSDVHKTPDSDTPTYDIISRAVESVQLRNGNPNAVIFDAAAAGILDRLRATGGDEQYLSPPASYTNLQKLVSNSAGRDLYTGQWDQLAFAIRTDFTAEASREAAGSFKKLQVLFRIYGRFDIAILRPSAFEIVTGTAS